MDDAFLDLDAYLRRVGFQGPLAPTREALDRLIEAHAAAIPFENIDVLAGRVPRLDIASLQQKLVGSRRGGYCFEQNSLLFAVLRQAGFAVSRREGRVRTGIPSEVETARTHMTLQVVLEGGPLHVDVGYGGLTPNTPLALDSRAPQGGSAGTYQFVEVDRDLLLQLETDEGWTDCYRVTASEPQTVDYEMANWWVATRPGAFLRENLLVGRATATVRMTLFNRELSLRRPRLAAPEKSTLTQRSELADVLADGFGLVLGGADLDLVMAVVSDRSTA
jgi:N-hydroxyarylamine O-acetyltransferase